MINRLKFFSNRQKRRQLKDQIHLRKRLEIYRRIYAILSTSPCKTSGLCFYLYDEILKVDNTFDSIYHWYNTIGDIIIIFPELKPYFKAGYKHHRPYWFSSVEQRIKALEDIITQHLGSGHFPYIPKEPSFNMDSCQEGDTLETTHGKVVTYVSRLSGSFPYQHLIRYENGTVGVRNDRGYEFDDPLDRKKDDENIVRRIAKASAANVQTIVIGDRGRELAYTYVLENTHCGNIDSITEGLYKWLKDNYYGDITALKPEDRPRISHVFPELKQFLQQHKSHIDADCFWFTSKEDRIKALNIILTQMNDRQ